MKFKIILLTTFVVIALLSGCSETKRLKNETLNPYPSELDMGFHYRLFHHSKDACLLNFFGLLLWLFMFKNWFDLFLNQSLNLEERALYRYSESYEGKNIL